MQPIADPDWGCDHHELTNLGSIEVKVCLVEVTDLKRLAKELAEAVTSTSWMLELDPGMRRSSQKTVAETAELLTAIFAKVESTVTTEFGEIMVSRGSARALEMIFSHKALPLAELWKPRVKQNEGFDFHTVCASPMVNFGEAKYSGSKSPHGLALTQIDDFLDAEKHYRDRIYLRDLCPPEAITSLDSEQFGVVAAFSVNGSDRIAILSNARDAALVLANKYKIKQIFVVGVVYDAT